MAMNFTHRLLFPSHLSEDCYITPTRNVNESVLEGISGKGGDAFVMPWYLGHEIQDCFDYRRGEIGDWNSSSESCSKEVIDLLPLDPFLMDISTTFTAITGWLKDLPLNCEGYGIINKGNNGGEYDSLMGLNFTGDRSMLFQAFPRNRHNLGEKSDFTLDVMNKAVDSHIEEPKGVAKSASSEGGDWVLQQALSYSLSLLGVQDLLSVELVCKSLQSTVRNNPILWRSIHINEPLNKKIYDDVLFQLASRAQGNLQSLSLVECPMITDDGLRDILEANARLTKLCVPGCTRLSIEGIVNNLKAFNSKNKPGIKYLRIGGLYDIMEKHFEELKFLLGIDIHTRKTDHKLHFYHKGILSLSCDDDRSIDIEICPKCLNSRLVYDCPSESCQENRDACRACRLCIPRCVQCGCCFKDSEYEENFLLDLRCLCCP